MKISIIRVIDLETGPDPIEGEPGIVEYGHVDLRTSQHDMLGEPFDWYVGESVNDQLNFFVKPHAPIPTETSAIHNIIDDDVAAASAWRELAHCVTHVGNHHQTLVAFAAHNIECEKTRIGEAAGGLPWIDTYKIALRLWPESLSHSNNAIRYYLNPAGLDRRFAVPTHRALPDAYVTAFTLREALNAGNSVETLIRWSSEPSILPRCKIGKFRNDGKGTPWREVDSGFLWWMLDKDFDTDTKHTARYHLEQREMDQREQSELDNLNRQYRQNGLPETQSFNDRSTAGQTPAPVGRDKNTMELPL